jgi:FkbM family methyltransferase
MDDLIEKILSTKKQGPIYFIQVGAGAGDLDPRANFRDGFTELIKKLRLPESSRIILVEPNPFNLDQLKNCWNEFSNIEIFELGIVPKSYSQKILRFFFTELDKPHYQMASFNPQHVLKKYRNLKESDLNVINVDTLDLKTFLDQVTRGDKIALLALDVESLETEILLETDFSSINICFLSFERLHLGARELDVMTHLSNCGFEFVGSGVDHNGYDVLFQKLHT